jgi:hypothetical protein
MQNFDNFDSEHLQPTVQTPYNVYYYALFGTRFSTFKTIPKALASLISKGVTELLNLSTKLQPDYEFIAKCYDENYPGLFSDFPTSQDLINRIRCKLLLDVYYDPISNYNAFLAHPEQFKKSISCITVDGGWILRSVLLVIENVDQDYIDFMKLIRSQRLDIDPLEPLGNSHEERWRLFMQCCMQKFLQIDTYVESMKRLRLFVGIKFLTPSIDPAKHSDTWIENYRQLYGDSELDKTLIFLASKCRTKLVKNSKQYDSIPLHRLLCLIETYSLQIVPRDFIKCPPCAAPTGLVTASEQPLLSEAQPILFEDLSPEAVYQIYVDIMNDDIVYALTVYRLVCKGWNQFFTLSDVASVLHLTKASLPAAKLLIADAIVQNSRKTPRFSVRPWPVMTNEELYKVVIEVSKCHEHALDLVNVLIHQFGFLGMDYKYASHSRILSFFVDEHIELYKETVRKAKFDSYEQLDCFMRGFAKNLRNSNVVNGLKKKKDLPFVLNREILWPHPKEFESGKFDEIWSVFTLSHNNIVDYLHRVAEIPGLLESIRHPALLEKILGKCDPNILLLKMISLYRRPTEHSKRIATLVLDIVSPGDAQKLESGDTSPNLYPGGYTRLTAGERCPDLDKAINRILASPPPKIPSFRVASCLAMLAYICLNPDIFTQDELKRFVEFLLAVGINYGKVRDVAFLATVGGPYSIFL